MLLLCSPEACVSCLQVVCRGCCWGGAVMWSLVGGAWVGPCCQDWRCIQFPRGAPLSAGQLPSGDDHLLASWFGEPSQRKCHSWSDLCISSSSPRLFQAYRKLEELQKRLPSQNVRYYISPASLDALQKEMGLPADGADHTHSVKEEDEVEEDLNLSWIRLIGDFVGQYNIFLDSLFVKTAFSDTQSSVCTSIMWDVAVSH